MRDKLKQLTEGAFTQHPDVTCPFPLEIAGPELVQHCPKCGKWGQTKVRFRGRRAYIYVDHYGTKRKPTSHHIRYSHSHYIGPLSKFGTEAENVLAMRWRVDKLLREQRTMRRKMEQM